MINIQEQAQIQLEKIEELIRQDKVEDAAALYLKLIDVVKSSTIEGEIAKKYAYFLMDYGMYEGALHNFKVAHELGHEVEEIKEFVFYTFLEANTKEFQETYKKQSEEIKEHFLSQTLFPKYEELELEFLPFEEDRYYIYDKKDNKFLNILDLSESAMEQYYETQLEEEFIGIVLSNDFDMNQMVQILASKDSREISYLYKEEEKNRFFSFFKVPEIANKLFQTTRFFKNLDQFQEYYHTNTSQYLPKLCLTKNDVLEIEIKKIIETEHEFRKTPEGRKDDHVLLTIGVPSYNRGHRCLENVKQLLELSYDAEIEIFVSNNASTKFVEDYQEIEAMEDSRLRYVKTEENIGPHLNFCKVLSMAKGDYVLFISDEDSLNGAALSHYLGKLKENPNISFVRSSGCLYCGVDGEQLYPQGRESFLGAFLATNYITGLIFKTKLFEELHLKDWTLAEVAKNNFAVINYAHSCWAAICAYYGDYLDDCRPLFIEGEGESDIPLIDGQHEEEEVKFLPYGTLEKRLEQHEGFIELLNQLSERMEEEVIITAYKILIMKTFLLVNLVREKYLKLGKNWDDICLQISYACVDGIPKLKIQQTSETQNELLEVINQQYLYYSNI